MRTRPYNHELPQQLTTFLWCYEPDQEQSTPHKPPPTNQVLFCPKINTDDNTTVHDIQFKYNNTSSTVEPVLVHSNLTSLLP